MTCVFSPTTHLAVRIVVAVCSLIVLAMMLTAVAAPYVKISEGVDFEGYSASTSSIIALFRCTESKTEISGGKTFIYSVPCQRVGHNPSTPLLPEENAAAAFEIIAIVFSALSLTVTIILVAIQASWNSARPCMVNAEPVLAIIVVVANAVVTVSCVIALGVMAYVVSDVIKYAHAGFFVLIPGFLFSLTALVLSAIPPCMGYTCCTCNSLPAKQQPGPQSYPDNKASESYGSFYGPNAGGTASYV